MIDKETRRAMLIGTAVLIFCCLSIILGLWAASLSPAQAAKPYNLPPGQFGWVVAAEASLKPLGFAQVTDLSSAVGLPSIPANANVAYIQVIGNNVRWRDDGPAPTAPVGMLRYVGDEFGYNGDLTAIKFIQTGAGASLNISYYGL